MSTKGLIRRLVWWLAAFDSGHGIGTHCPCLTCSAFEAGYRYALTKAPTVIVHTPLGRRPMTAEERRN